MANRIMAQIEKTGRDHFVHVLAVAVDFSLTRWSGGSDVDVQEEMIREEVDGVRIDSWVGWRRELLRVPSYSASIRTRSVRRRSSRI